MWDDMKLTPEQRAIMWFSQYANGKHLCEPPEKEVQEFISKHNPLRGLNQHANLDLLWLSRIANCHGNVFVDQSMASGEGVEWLVPFGAYVQEVAINFFFDLNTQTKEEKDKVYEDSTELKKAFGNVWHISPKEIVLLEHEEGPRLDFHLALKSVLFNLDGTLKERKNVDDDFFSSNLPDIWHSDYKKMKHNLRYVAPYKFYRLDKEDTLDVDMWDGRKYTDMRKDSVDKLLAQEGYSFRMKDYYEQGGEKIFEEIDEKRIIRAITPKQFAQKAVSKTAYFTRMHRVSKMAMLISTGIVGIKIVRNDKTYLDDKHWLSEDYPKIDLIHLMPTIVKIVPYMTKNAKEYWPTHEVNSVRSAEKLFDDITKEFSLKSELFEWEDKDIQDLNS